MLEAKVAGHDLDVLTYGSKHRRRETEETVVASAAQPVPMHHSMPVSRIMTDVVTTFPAETRIAVATATLLAHGISGAPIVDATGKPIGMVSKTDLLEAWQQQVDSEGDGSGDTEDVQVGDIMVPYLLAVSHRAPISLATALMAYEGVHRLVVLGENSQMVGIVSSLDILRWVAQLSGFCLPHAAHKQSA
jgi:CBS domain-containing protein